MVGAYESITLAAAVVFGSLAVATAVRRHEGQLTLPLGLLCLSLFAYCVIDTVEELAPGPVWHGLTEATAAAAVAPALSLLAGFVGLRHRLRVPLRAAYVYFGALAALSLGAHLSPALERFPGSPGWAAAMLAVIVPSVGLLGRRFVRHARTSPPAERVRCQLLGAAGALGFGGVVMDLAAIGGLPVPRLAPIGLAMSSLVLGVMLLETRGLFDRPKRSALLALFLLVLVAVIGEILVVAIAGRRIGLLVLGSALVLFALAVAVRPLLVHLSERRARRRYLQTLGQWVDQITHDVLNPTAAIKGAAQVAQDDLRREGTVDPKFLDLIVEKADQLERTVRDFERLARVRPDLSPVDITDLLDALVRAEAAARGPQVQVDSELEPDLPQLRADAALLAAALENLAANAAQAMPRGGRLTVRAHAVHTPLGRRVVIELEDTGVGIDPRTLERAFEPGFTTRAAGRGNGLPYVREIAQAHGGTVGITSQLGRGATVRLELPVPTERA